MNHLQGHPQLSLKCRWPNRISFDDFDGCSAKLKRGHVKRYAVARNVRGPRGHDFSRGLVFI